MKIVSIEKHLLMSWKVSMAFFISTSIGSTDHTMAILRILKPPYQVSLLNSKNQKMENRFIVWGGCCSRAKIIAEMKRKII